MTDSPPPLPGKPGRLPILLSALVCPGVGQWVQRRWAAGTLFFALFCPAVLVCLFFAGRNLYLFYAQAFSSSPPDEVPGTAGIFWSLALTIGIYVLSLVDTYAAQRRAMTNYNRQKHGCYERCA